MQMSPLPSTPFFIDHSNQYELHMLLNLNIFIELGGALGSIEQFSQMDMGQLHRQGQT